MAVSVVESPSQIVTSAPALAVGNGLTVTVTLSLSEQPLVVTVTEYTVVELGLTLIPVAIASSFVLYLLARSETNPLRLQGARKFPH